MIGLLAGCAHDVPSPTVSALDGFWTSSQLDYDLVLSGMIGFAERARTAGIQDGDPVLRLSAMEGTRITARQWMPDGHWHTVRMERKADGTLSCTDGTHSWTLERKPMAAP